MESYKNYLKSVEKVRPSLLKYVHVIMCSIATLIFKSRQVCITVWQVGPSSSGKGEILKLTTQLPDEAKEFEKSIFHRSDKFTENSFVSNRADVKTEEAREKLDLLRKLPDRVLVTAELGSFVTGHKDKLAEKFGILTRVLDGEGLSTDTGAHGHRAVDQKVEFVWIGGVTELTPNKHEALSQIGGRVMTLDIDIEVTDEEKLAADIRSGFKNDGTSEISTYLNKLYHELFERFPQSSVDPSSVVIPDDVSEAIAGLSTLGARLRSNVSISKEEEGGHSARASIEKPYRFAKNLHLLARASAVLRGHTTVDFDDVGAVVLPIALSSGPEVRHRVFAYLSKKDDNVSMKELLQHLPFGKTAIYSALKELKALSLLEAPDSIMTGEDIYPRFMCARKFQKLIRQVDIGCASSDFLSPTILRTQKNQPDNDLVRETEGEGVARDSGYPVQEELSWQ